MKAPNHIAGGIVFTGIFASLSGVNIFATPLAIGTTVLASLLPDLDYPKSIIGRSLFPISKWLNRNYGHRTITHSGIVLILSTLVISFIEKIIAGQTALSLIFFYAFSSHLVFDMMTLQGVPLLYPFYKNPFVIPGNPGFRIRTGDVRSETVIFCFFILAGFSLRPLFANGFWTSYNRLFGTMTHLASEFQRSEDLLEVEYFARLGSQPIQGKGYCIKATERQAVLIENGAFRILDADDLVIEKVIPAHSEQQFFYQTKTFVQAPIDSVNLCLYGNLIAETEISANHPFIVHDHQVRTQQRHYKASYRKNIWLENSPHLVIRDTFIPAINPRIAVLSSRLTSIKAENRLAEQQWQEHLRHLERLRKATVDEKDIVLREKRYQLYQELLKRKPPKIDLVQAITLEVEIQELQKAQRLKNRQQQQILLRKQQEATQAPILFTGTITTIKIQ